MSPLEFDPRNDGYWGDTTSTLDWCETNYEVSWYIAEFWNTITNLSMIIPPLYGFQQIISQRLEKRFFMSFVAFLLVGVGSTMFHMTLQYSMQLMDEIPMVWSSGAFLYNLYLTDRLPGERALTSFFTIIFYCSFFTIVYYIWPFPIIHQVLYGILVVLILLQACVILRRDWNWLSTKIFILGLFLYGGGFLLWNFENHFCPLVQSIRSSLPRGLRPLTQLHGWWHLTAGYATYLNIQFSIFHRLKHLKREPKYAVDWIGVTVVGNREKKV